MTLTPKTPGQRKLLALIAEDPCIFVLPNDETPGKVGVSVFIQRARGFQAFTAATAEMLGMEFDRTRQCIRVPAANLDAAGNMLAEALDCEWQLLGIADE